MTILRVYRLIALMLMIAILLPVQMVMVKFFPSRREMIPLFFHRQTARFLGMRIEVQGNISTKRPTIFIANHSSYLDIVILGALAPLSFVAKAEIARWPLFGTLARLQNTVFVDRKRRNAGEHVDAVAKHLAEKKNVVIFPEGTSGDGNRILPFKPTLFRVATGHGDIKPVIQPVTINYTHLNGLPITRYERPFFAWYGDMGLPGHLWHLLGLGKFTVHTTFFEPLTENQFASHKELSAYCQAIVSEAFSKKLSGHEITLNRGFPMVQNLTPAAKLLG